MPLTKHIKYAYLLPGGIINCYDANGNLLKEFTQFYSLLLHKRIILEATDNCEYIGFDILPNGFNVEACRIIEYRSRNLSWDEYLNETK